MLPNILGSTVSHHHNRHRSRNISGGNQGVGITNNYDARYATGYDKYLRAQKLNRTRHSSGSDSDVVNSYHPQNYPRRPRSADPSPHRTTSRIESMGQMHGGPLLARPSSALSSRFQPTQRHVIGGYSSDTPMGQNRDSRTHVPPIPYGGGNHQSLVPVRTPIDVRQASSPSPHPHHHHEVVYVCHGQCTGPRCDFSKNTKQMQSVVYLDPSQQALQGNNQAPIHAFRSEVVETAPSAFRKLDKKRATISQMKEILAKKLENKHRQRLTRRQRNMEREKSRERSGGNCPKSCSSNTIERDVNVAESLYRHCGERNTRSQAGSDINEDLSLRGSKCFPKAFFSFEFLFNLVWFNRRIIFILFLLSSVQ